MGTLKKKHYSLVYKFLGTTKWLHPTLPKKAKKENYIILVPFLGVNHPHFVEEIPRGIYSKNKGHKIRPKPELQAERKSEFRMQDATRAQRTLHEDEERSRLTFRRGGDKVSKCTSFGPGQYEESIFIKFCY